MLPKAHEIAEIFYEAFIIKDAQTMANLYDPKASFSDEVFLNLSGIEAGSMWRMLCSGSKDLRLTYEILESSENVAMIKWHAYYTFSKTGRTVHNIITTKLTTSKGKIISQHDHFSFWNWSKQAFGPLGVLLGWTPILKNKVRGEALRSLNKFMNRN